MELGTLLVLTVAVALFFDFCNGWNDSANAIATVVSTRTLTPLAAVVFAAILNFAGAFAATGVAKMIGGGLITMKGASGSLAAVIVLASMLAAAGWVTFCTAKGLPISGSHSLIGGMVGAALAGIGTQALIAKGLVTVLVALVVSPVLGFVVGYFMLVGVYWAAYRMRPRTVRRTFSFLQVASSGYMAFTHGMNDAQKVMGVITLALVSAKKWPSPDSIPLWVMVVCATAMALGTAAGGWKVMRTLGSNLAHIRAPEGFAAEASAGAVLHLAGAVFHVPVSTTHTITGSIMGVGTAYQAKAVKWGVGAKIVYAWIFTLPVAGLLGAGVFLALKPILL